MKVKIASQNTGVMSTPKAGGTISLTACNNGCVGMTMSVIHMGKDVFSDFVVVAVVNCGTTVSDSSLDSVLVISSGDDGGCCCCCCCGAGVPAIFSSLLLPEVVSTLLATISGYQLRTTLDSMANDIKFKNGSNTFDKGCTHGSVCD